MMLLAGLSGGRPWAPATPVDTCGHRAPLNYDRTRWATCTQPSEHDGGHQDGEFVWTDRTMPWKDQQR